MNIKVIKLNSKHSYFIDKDKNKKMDRYDPSVPNMELVAKLEDGSVLRVDGSKVTKRYGGYIAFDYLDDTYIIDDGYQNMLTKSGYIVADNYDKDKMHDKEAGIVLRERILEKAYLAASNFAKKHLNAEFNKDSGILTVNEGGFIFTIVFDTNTSIVNKNQSRKINSLPFYPFNKNMDKYGTIYVSTFVQKVDKDVNANDKYPIADDIIKVIICGMNEDLIHQYHYSGNNITKRINYFESI